MKFKMIFDNGKAKEFAGGCYGCVGRTDSYSPHDDVVDVVESWNDSNDFTTESDSSRPEWCRTNTAAKYLVLPNDFYHGVVVEKLYHVSRYDLLDYLCTRSPYAPCFKEGSTASGIIESNEVVLNADGVSSEIVISLGYVLRAMCNDDIVLNWKAVRSACPEMPEFLSLVLSFCSRNLYRGSSSGLTANYGDGSLIPHDFSFSRIYNADPLLSGLSIRDVGGYVMNVSGMWKKSSERSSSESNFNKYEALVRKHSGTYEVQGVFGKFQANGIKDLRSFLLEVNELFSKGD